MGIIIPAYKEKLVRENKEGKKAALVVFSPSAFSTGLAGEKKKGKIREKEE